MSLNPQTANQKPRILLIDDEASIRLVFTNILKPYYHVTTASSGEEALELATSSSFDLALLDIHLPEISGLEVLESIRKTQPHIVVIMITAFGSVDNAVFSMRRGAINFLQKPASKEEILSSVKEGLELARRERQRNIVLRKARQLLEEGLTQLDQAVPRPTDLIAEAQQEERDQEQEQEQDRFIEKGSITIDTYRRMATLDGDLLDLTSGEYDLLLCLVQHAPQVLSPQKLVELTRGFEASLQEAREIIRWQIYLLRQKVEIDPSAPIYILNVRGRGYMWAVA